MKKHLLSAAVLTLSIFALAGCGQKVDYPSEGDRAVVTAEESQSIENKVKEMKGVISFEINHMEGGIYGELIVESKDDAKSLAIKAFNLMKVETNQSALLFVKLNDEDQTMLIQAFKPIDKDNENEWNIMY